jgi:hypothetical protein
MANSGWSFHCKRKIFSLEPEGHVDQADQNRDLQERADDGCEGLARIDSKNCHGHRNSEFKVIGCRCET